MPTSNLHQISDVVELIVAADPQSILDVGVGFGKYGVLAREYLELLDGRAIYGDWRRRIDGVEIFPDYLTGLHETVYDQVIVGDAAEILPGLGEQSYDLVLLIDVIEHFDRPTGNEILRQSLRVGRNVIVSTPLGFFTQEGFDNPHEQHRSRWSRRDLKSTGHPSFFLPETHVLLGFAGRDSARARARVLRLDRRLKRSMAVLVRPLRTVKRLFSRNPENEGPP